MYAGYKVVPGETLMTSFQAAPGCILITLPVAVSGNEDIYSKST
jgi:hypothetical protein